MMIAIGIAVANTRTESASARVAMNTIDVNRPRRDAESLLEQRVGRDELPVVVARQQRVRDDDPSDHVAGHDLQEPEIAECRRAP